MINTPDPDAAVRRAVRRFFDAVDRFLSAAREVELARTALEQAAARGGRLRIVSEERIGTSCDENAPESAG